MHVYIIKYMYVYMFVYRVSGTETMLHATKVAFNQPSDGCCTCTQSSDS